MKKELCLILNNEIVVYYSLNDIKNITYHIAKDIYSVSDLKGNDIQPDETVMFIHFKDGTEATFKSVNCQMKFL